MLQQKFVSARRTLTGQVAVHVVAHDVAHAVANHLVHVIVHGVSDDVVAIAENVG